MEARLTLAAALLAACLVATSDALGSNKFSSKNSYVQSFYADELYAANNPTNFDMNSCSLNQLQLLVRHGTRAPTAGTTNKVNAISQKLRNLGIADPGSWTNPFPFSEELTTAGEQELRLIGQRFLARYPTLMEAFRRSPNASPVYATSKKRTRDSALAFLKGIDPNRQWLVQEDNEALRFFDFCPSYDRLMAASVHRQELDAFLQSGAMQRAVSQVMANLRLPVGSVTADEINEMYGFCGTLIANGYDQTRYGWCKVFEGVDLDPFEYLSDMEAYYENGYGFDINYQISCPFIKKTLLNILDVATSAPTSNKVVLSFGHAETVIPVLAAIGLYKDQTPLLSRNYDALKTTRQWRMGRLSPFAANIAFLTWDCKQQGLAFQIVVNERIDATQPCSKWLCSYQFFYDRLKSFAQCDFSGLCTGALPSGGERLVWNRLSVTLTFLLTSATYWLKWNLYH